MGERGEKGEKGIQGTDGLMGRQGKHIYNAHKEQNSSIFFLFVQVSKAREAHQAFLAHKE